jgi:hypothetical protein
MDQGVLHLEPLSEDEVATASDVTAVLQRIGTDDAGPLGAAGAGRRAAPGE